MLLYCLALQITSLDTPKAYRDHSPNLPDHYVLTAKRARAGFLGGKGGMRQMTLFGSGPTPGWMLMMLMILTDFNLNQSQQSG